MIAQGVGLVSTGLLLGAMFAFGVAFSLFTGSKSLVTAFGITAVVTILSVYSFPVFRQFDDKVIPAVMKLSRKRLSDRRQKPRVPYHWIHSVLGLSISAGLIYGMASVIRAGGPSWG